MDYLNEGILGPDDVFNINLDTQTRLGRVFSQKDNYEVPASPLPDINPTDPSQQVPLFRGLASDDPDISSVAAQTLQSFGENSNAEKYHQGFEIKTPIYNPNYDSNKFGLKLVAQDAEKYIGNKYGFDPTRNNEEYYYQNEVGKNNSFVNAAKSVPEFLARTAVSAVYKFGESLGYAGAIINPENWVNGNFMANVADNALSKELTRMEKNTLNTNLLAVYHGLDYNNKGLFEKLGDSTFWTESGADGLAFMLSAMGPGLALKGLGLAGEAASLAAGAEEGAMAATFFGNAGRAARIGNKAMQFVGLGSKTWQEFGMLAYNTATEAAFEATDGFTTMMQNLKADRAGGKNNMTDDEMRDVAGNAAATRFLGNLAILGFSNAWENRLVFGARGDKGLVGNVGKLFGEGADVAEKGVSEVGADLSVGRKGAEALASSAKESGKTSFLRNVFDVRNPNSRLRHYGEMALEGTWWEGYWEENAQLVVQRMNLNDTQFYQKDKDENPMQEFFGRLIKQAVDSAKGKDEEAAESIFLGAVMGVISPIVMSKMAREKGGAFMEGERRINIRKGDAMIAAINNARAQYLSIMNTVFNEDGSLNTTNFDLKLNELKRSVDASISIEKVQDPGYKEFLQKKLFTNYVLATIDAGRFESMLTSISNLGNKSNEEIKALGFNPSDIKNKTFNLIDFANERKADYEKLQKLDLTPPDEVRKKYSDEEIAAINTDRKTLAFKSMAQSAAIQHLVDSENLDMSGLEAHLSQRAELENTITKSLMGFDTTSIRQLNILEDNISSQKSTLDQMEKDNVITEYERKARKQEIAQMQQQYDELEKSVKDGLSSFNEGKQDKIELKKQDKPIGKEEDKKTLSLFVTGVPEIDEGLVQSVMVGRRLLQVTSIQKYGDLHTSAMLDVEKGMENYHDFMSTVNKGVREAIQKFIPSKAQKDELSSLGYSEKEIGKMTMQQVEATLKDKVSKVERKEQQSQHKKEEEEEQQKKNEQQKEEEKQRKATGQSLPVEKKNPIDKEFKKVVRTFSAEPGEGDIETIRKKIEAAMKASGAQQTQVQDYLNSPEARAGFQKTLNGQKSSTKEKYKKGLDMLYNEVLGTPFSEEAGSENKIIIHTEVKQKVEEAHKVLETLEKKNASVFTERFEKNDNSKLEDIDDTLLNKLC